MKRGFISGGILVLGAIVVLGALGFVAANKVQNAGSGGAVINTGGALTSADINTSAELAAIVGDETGTAGSLVFSGSPALTTPDLGTPSALTLTNATGLPISTGVSGLAAGIADWLGTPSSANLITALTDETGTGSAVFSIGPTLTGLTVSGGNTTLATTTIAGDITFRPNYSTQDYLLTTCQAVGNCLAWQGQNSGTDSLMRLFSKDGDGTDNVYYATYGVGSPSDLTNVEVLYYGYNGSTNTVDFISAAGGTGTLRKMRLFTGANDQLTLDTDGNVGIASSTPQRTLSIDGSVAIQEATLVDAATITWNLATSTYARVVLGGNRTLDITNATQAIGQSVRLVVCASGGAYSITSWDALIMWPSATAPTQTATDGNCDVFSGFVTNASSTPKIFMGSVLAF